MNVRRSTSILLLGLQLLWTTPGIAKENTTAPAPVTITIPLGGNGWVTTEGRARITSEGVKYWSSVNDVVSVYFRVSSTGKARIAIKGIVPEGKSKISLTVSGTTLTKELSNNKVAVVDFGELSIKKVGYIRVDLRGISKTGNVFAEISDILVKSSAVAEGTTYVKDNEENFFYWGRRGASVHLKYQLPNTKNEWVYSEVLVPEGGDKVGSYYMANGFGEGYFGMQVNSETQRRVLFSIWSPYTTDDPRSIPADQRVKLKRKGENTKTGEFGNEGSGGQSYIVYPWKTGTTYAFLTHIEPDFTRKTTTYTAYFREADKGDWILIARFERPQTATYFTYVYSFLENFQKDMGDQTRMAIYKNQWVIDTDKKWHELTKATFTIDNTGKKNYRKDYAGGVNKQGFYLRICGFFDAYTENETPLERASSKQPVINFRKLP